jgi:hypothetical protein
LHKSKNMKKNKIVIIIIFLAQFLFFSQYLMAQKYLITIAPKKKSLEELKQNYSTYISQRKLYKAIETGEEIVKKIKDDGLIDENKELIKKIYSELFELCQENNNLECSANYKRNLILFEREVKETGQDYKRLYSTFPDKYSEIKKEEETKKEEGESISYLDLSYTQFDNSFEDEKKQKYPFGTLKFGYKNGSAGYFSFDWLFWKDEYSYLKPQGLKSKLFFDFSSDWGSWRAGLTKFGEPDSIIIYYGPKPWPHIPKTNDYQLPFFEYKLLLTKTEWKFVLGVKKLDYGAASGDKNLSYLLGIKMKNYIIFGSLVAEIYYYAKTDDIDKYDSSKYISKNSPKIIGGKLENDYLSDFEYSIEYNKKFGSYNFEDYRSYPYTIINKDYDSYSYRVKAGLKLSQKPWIKLAGEYTFFSGDTNNPLKITEYKPLNNSYTPGILAERFIDSDYKNKIGSGLKVMGGVFSFSPFSKLDLSFNYYQIDVAKPNIGFNSKLGIENDIMLTLFLSKSFVLRGYYSIFTPDELNLSKINNPNVLFSKDRAFNFDLYISF